MLTRPRLFLLSFFILGIRQTPRPAFVQPSRCAHSSHSLMRCKSHLLANVSNTRTYGVISQAVGCVSSAIALPMPDICRLAGACRLRRCEKSCQQAVCHANDHMPNEKKWDQRTMHSSVEFSSSHRQGPALACTGSQLHQRSGLRVASLVQVQSEPLTL